MDQREFRNALGTFATGITVITTSGDTSEPVGITANSFTSVSLEPPLILWCLDNDADSFDAFQNNTHFGVHVLHQGQEDISQRFATKNTDKFADINWIMSESGTPKLDDFAVYFECERENIHVAGDHIIIVGRVLSIEQKNTATPLLYYSGSYRTLST